LNNADAVDCLNQKLMESVDGVLKRSGHSLAPLASNVKILVGRCVFAPSSSSF
jgi:hypothetical protein